MTRLQVGDFKVDAKKRRVRHKSGIEFSYYARLNDKDWIDAGPDFVRNPSLYDGDYRELFFAAKLAALCRGMQRA